MDLQFAGMFVMDMLNVFVVHGQLVSDVCGVGLSANAHDVLLPLLCSRLPL